MAIAYVEIAEPAVLRNSSIVLCIFLRVLGSVWAQVASSTWPYLDAISSTSSRAAALASVLEAIIDMIPQIYIEFLCLKGEDWE